MKLFGSERRPSRQESAVSVLRQEQEPDLLFDYERDVPATTRKKFEARFIQVGWVNFTPYYLTQVLERPDLLQRRLRALGQSNIQTASKEWLNKELEFEETRIPQRVKGDFGEACRLIEVIFDRQAFLDSPDPRVNQLKRLFTEKLAPEHTALTLETLWGVEVKVDVLFTAYKLFPEQRTVYTRLAEEKFQEALNHYAWSLKAPDLVSAAAIGLEKLWFLCPNKRDELTEFAAKLKTKTPDVDRFDDGAGIFILTLISKYDAEITPQGRLEFRKKKGLPQATALPERKVL